MNEQHKLCRHATDDGALLEAVKNIALQYRGTEGALIQVLHMAQGVYGHLPLEVQKVVADALDLPLTTVSGVVSFYSFFATEPRGKHTIRVCMGTACYVRGGVSLVDALQSKLGVQVGHTTADGMFTFEIARCIGACGLAPAMTIDSIVYPQVTPDALDGILNSWYESDAAEEAKK